jgi:prevent-host-death family protein
VKHVGTFEGKTHFSRLVDEAARGETIVITRKGKPVAQLGPVQDLRPSPEEALERLFALAAPLGVPIRELLEEGRRG